MKTPLYSKALSYISLLCLLVIPIALVLDATEIVGVASILFFFSLALLCTGNEKLRSFTYTLIILSLVCLAMFFPSPFQQVGDVKLTVLIVPLLQAIMFSVGSQMGVKDFEEVARAPKAVLIGLIGPFFLMPIIGFTLAMGFPLQPEIAAGLILIGCSPSGLASNVMCFLAKANLALSVTLTACSTLIAPLATPLLMGLLAGQFVPIDFWAMMSGIIKMVIFPIMAGVMFNAVAYGKVSPKQIKIQFFGFLIGILVIQSTIGLIGGQEGALTVKTLSLLIFWILLLPPFAGLIGNRIFSQKKELLEKVMAFLAMAGIGTIMTVITAAGRDDLLTIGLWLMLACVLHNLGGYCTGYWLGRLFKMDERTCRTIAIEVGQQNGGLASGIAVQMGKAATLGLAPAVFGALQNITGSALATWWRRVPIEDENTPTSENPEVRIDSQQTESISKMLK